MIFIVFNTKQLNKNNSYNKITKFIEKTFFSHVILTNYWSALYFKK